MTRAALVIVMDWSLRGHEILLTDLHRTEKLATGHEKEGDVGSYIIIGLLGRFKGEMGEIII